MTLSFRLADASDDNHFARTADGLFDRKIDPALLSEFLTDPRHHIAVASDDGVIVGFVSAVDYVHPDKRRQLWINEVAVAPSHRRQGVGSKLMQMMLNQARNMGCSEAWVLTDADNKAANGFYRSALPDGAVEPDPQLMYSFPLCL